MNFLAIEDVRLLMKSWLGVVLLTSAAAGAQQDAPLPAMKDLQARAVANYARSAKDRERYICTERIEDDDLTGRGAVKKRSVREREVFYVNGFQVSQEVGRNARTLTPGEKAKEDARVKAEIEAASAHRKPREQGLVISAGDILRFAQLQHERRVLVSGRPTIVFDVVSDPAAKPTNVEQKLVSAMEGTVSIDEATGNLQDVNTHGVRDVKVGGGLVLNIHKGFRTHILVAPQGSEGVWLLVLAEGSGDGRAGLFLTGGVAFRQETLGCKVFDVNAEGKTPVDGKK